MEYDKAAFQWLVKQKIEEHLSRFRCCDIGFPADTKEDVMQALEDMGIYHAEVAGSTIELRYRRSILDYIKCVFGFYTKGVPYIAAVGLDRTIIPEHVNWMSEMPISIDWISVARTPETILQNEARR